MGSLNQFLPYLSQGPREPWSQGSSWIKQHANKHTHQRPLPPTDGSLSLFPSMCSLRSKHNWCQDGPSLNLSFRTKCAAQNVQLVFPLASEGFLWGFYLVSFLPCFSEWPLCSSFTHCLDPPRQSPQKITQLQSQTYIPPNVAEKTPSFMYFQATK